MTKPRNHTGNQPIDDLRKYLEKTPPGRIDNAADLENLLDQCWDELEGDIGGMAGNKLHGRMEDVEWNPPILRFTIERHGGTVMGSSRAELQDWRIDVEVKRVYCSVSSYRQIYPREPALNVNPIADEIRDLILNREQDDRLKWFNDRRVQILTGKIIPDWSTAKQTLAGRRKRFRKALTERLQIHGWRETRPSVYELAQPV